MRDLRFFAPRRPLEPGEDGRVWAYYYIEDISSPTQIIYAAGGVGSTLIVDGVSVPRNGTTYQFTSTGMHLIRYNMACTAKNFLSISTVKEIYIPNSVTSLPYQFIDNAHNLEKLVAPSVTTLSASGIGIRNTSIHEVILPSVTNFVEALGSAQTYLELESVVQIGPDAANRPTVFGGASNMQTIILGPNCQTLGSRLFQSVNWIPTIVIKATTPPTVMYGAMSNMGSNVKFYVPYSSDHSILGAYKIADGFSSYASQIFELCVDGSIPIIFEDPVVEQICVDNFTNNNGHVSYEDAAKVTSLTGFANNTSITSFKELIYFTGVTSIDHAKFKGCSNLVDLGIPESCTSFGLQGTTNLANIYISNLEKYLRISYGNGLDNGYSKTLNCANNMHLFLNDVEVTSATFPSDMTIIPAGALANMSNITSITLPTNYTAIGKQAFLRCSSWVSNGIVTPSSLTRIYDGAFKRCSNISAITLHSTLTSMGSSDFQYCTGLTDLIIPSSVSSLNGNAVIFSGNGTGILSIGGDLNPSSVYNGGRDIHYKKVIIGGDVIPNSSIRNFINANNSEVEEVRIEGDFISGSWVNAGIIEGRQAKLKFLELGGIASGASELIRNALTIASGCIVHLKHNGIACTPVSIRASATNLTTIYVGDGTSQASDQAVLDLYLADTDWAQYASKLDLWYNYSGTYKQ